MANGLEVCVWDEENLAVGVDYRIGKLPPHLPRLARAVGVMSGKIELVRCSILYTSNSWISIKVARWRAFPKERKGSNFVA